MDIILNWFNITKLSSWNIEYCYRLENIFIHVKRVKSLTFKKMIRSDDNLDEDNTLSGKAYMQKKKSHVVSILKMNEKSSDF